MGDREFDVIVMGAGPAGEVAAGRAADGGLEVAIVEPHLIGGECSFYACMPSKALLRPAELLAEVGRVPGITANGIDAAAALARRDEVIHDLSDESMLPWLEDKGIELFRGSGRLDGERTVVVGDETLTARKAVIVGTGSSASLPPIDGLAEAKPWTNREGTTAKAVPESLIVVGGGPVGCELSQAWSTLGSEVTLVEVAPRLLAREEEFASEQVTESLRSRGIDVRVDAKPESVHRDGDEIWLEFENSDSPVRAEQMLVAAGRKPNTADIGLDTVGLEPGESIEVDDRLRAGGSDWLYAIGDVNGRSLLTHAGKYQARIAADVILGHDTEARTDLPAPPRVTFTDPEVAAVGHTLASAEEAGISARAVDVTTSGNAGASFRGRDTEGTSRFVVDEKRRVLAGATFVGFETAELLHAATIAVSAEISLGQLWHAIPAFPTRSEVWLKLLEEYGC